MDLRDYFISYNSADAAHAEAINTALRDAGYTTHFAGTDLRYGGNIPIWMDRALSATTQVLALCSPDYFKPEAVYSEVERAAVFWADPVGVQAMLVPVEIAPCTYGRLYAGLRRITSASGMTPDAAAAAVIEALKDAELIKQHEAQRQANATPDVFFVPRKRDTGFLGRDIALTELHQTLSHGHNAAVTQAIAGLGGIGKTTLAAEYAHRFGTKGRYGGVWWVAAESPAGIVEGLAELARKIGREERQNLPEMAREARDFLQTSTPPWLVIFDNVPDADRVREWLPAGSARVLITSRAQDFTGLAEVTRLDEWDMATTAEYLLRVTKREDRAGAEALAGKLGGLPLAANQAAAFLTQRSGITFTQYAADLDRLLARAKDAGNRGDYPETVFATLVKSLEVLPAETQDLLCLLAWLSPDGVDEELLTATVVKTPEFLTDRFCEALRNDYTRADLVKTALDLSLIRTDGDPGWGQILTVHRVVQAVLRVWQRTEGIAGWDVRAAQIVNRVFPYNAFDAPANWPRCARLLPHARELGERGPSVSDGGTAMGRLLNQSGVFLTSRGDAVGAIKMLETAADLARANYGDESVEFASPLSTLAGCYVKTGRMEEAKAAALRSLEIKERLLGPGDPEVAITLNNLACVLIENDEFARAEPLMIRAADIDRKANGPESVQYSWRLVAVGVLYGRWAQQTGELTRLPEAKRLVEEALQIVRVKYGERHPDVSHCCHNLATISIMRGDLAGATSHETRAVAIDLSLDLSVHPETQQRIGQLVELLSQGGEGPRVARLRVGEIADLLPEIAAVEAEMQAWVAEDPDNRHFGPPPFAEHKGKMG
jgi:tetratricopeptide (TPR) repeat protein